MEIFKIKTITVSVDIFAGCFFHDFEGQTIRVGVIFAI